MRLLLDTHVALWWLADDRRLGREATEAIADPEHAVHLSAASVWEMAIKRRLGKLDVPDDLVGTLAGARIDALDITASHALAAGDLPPLHTDPFDRMLVAQARVERLVLVTADPQIMRYDVAVLRAAAS